MMNKYDKMRTATVSYLKGASMFDVLENLYFAEEIHAGKRKDGSPEFYHQLCMINYARNLPILESRNYQTPRKNVFNCILGHDLFEDYVKTLPKSNGSEFVMSKIGKTTDFYYEGLLGDFSTAATKGIDRVHNLSSMIPAFTHEKQQRYITETREYVLPLIDKAKRKFPEQETTFRAIKHSLLLMVDMWEGLNGSN